ncbi:MAG: hypothetical protein Sv326_1321 (plasmid) [Candidatus Fermentimicrarchaeum limneticum]|uniref:Uncharacterized protein n=1 Tax=Fermentimicrarchaeum limneticum TaxID=2795018 RepID=A0A7D6BM93_FERL1|nr:MAG: hypothetical protein Sv326_1321 [Candidatus Fermentimicrarchaeum limneticum]
MYEELEKIVVKGAKDDYLFFEVGMLAVGAMLVIGLFSAIPDMPALVITATGLIIFVVVYMPLDVTMQAKVKARKDMMEELKKDVK